MAQYLAENERAKREYLHWMKEADVKDENTLDRVAARLPTLKLRSKSSHSSYFTETGSSVTKHIWTGAAIFEPESRSP